MARRVKITSAGGEAVTGRLAVAADPSPIGVLLAHGAGAGQEHPWMVTMRDGLAGAGYTTMTFDYAYTDAGRKSPDRPGRLLDVHLAAFERMRDHVGEVVLAGKSMGGRMASHLVDDAGIGAAGLVYYGYPLVPIGTGEPRPTDHLRRIDVPQLFFAGTRDRLGPPPLIAALVAELPDAELVTVDDGDHSFRVPKRSGRTDTEVLSDLVAATAGWIDRTAAARP